MALATQCPHCLTSFRVANDQLKLHYGLVRCGSCKKTFNGIEHLLPPEETQQPRIPKKEATSTKTTTVSTNATSVLSSATHTSAPNINTETAPTSASTDTQKTEQVEKFSINNGVGPKQSFSAKTHQFKWELPSIDKDDEDEDADDEENTEVTEKPNLGSKGPARNIRPSHRALLENAKTVIMKHKMTDDKLSAKEKDYSDVFPITSFGRPQKSSKKKPSSGKKPIDKDAINEARREIAKKMSASQGTLSNPDTQRKWERIDIPTKADETKISETANHIIREIDKAEEITFQEVEKEPAIQNEEPQEDLVEKLKRLNIKIPKFDAKRVENLPQEDKEPKLQSNIFNASQKDTENFDPVEDIVVTTKLDSKLNNQNKSDTPSQSVESLPDKIIGTTLLASQQNTLKENEATITNQHLAESASSLAKNSTGLNTNLDFEEIVQIAKKDLEKQAAKEVRSNDTAQETKIVPKFNDSSTPLPTLHTNDETDIESHDKPDTRVKFQTNNQIDITHSESTKLDPTLAKENEAIIEEMLPPFSAQDVHQPVSEQDLAEYKAGDFKDDEIIELTETTLYGNYNKVLSSHYGDEENGTDSDKPKFVRQAERKRKYGRLMKWMYAVGCLVLSIMLVGQIGFTFRNALAANYPSLKPYLLKYCEVLKCSIKLPQQAELLEITGTELVKLSNKLQIIQVNTILQNKSHTVQAWPKLALTFQDSRKRLVLRKIIEPQQYLDNPKLIATGINQESEHNLTIHLDLGNIKAENYTIHHFYD